MDFILIPSYILFLFLFDRSINIDAIRWFTLHSFTNLLIIITSFIDMKNILIDPLHNESTLLSYYPRILTIGLHTYHLIGFKKIEFIDYLHHFLMIGALSSTYYYEDLVITNYFLFFMTGLTGMFDYMMLALVKLNIMNKITEKKINSVLNNYIRYPLIMNGVSTLYFRYINNLYKFSTESYNIYGFVLLILIFFWNGSYFNYRVVHNYGKNCAKDLL
jgi:hypothetical protein